MTINNNSTFSSTAIFIVFCGLFSCSKQSETTISENAKLALRDAGHHLLLANQDATSLVKPVLALDDYKYQLAFENDLIIHPDSLVAIVKNSFKKVALPQNYLVEVLQCNTQQVVYSYQMNKNVEESIIPCGGRQLNIGCYLIQVRFINSESKTTSNAYYLGFLLLVGLSCLAFVFYMRTTKKTSNIQTQTQDKQGITIGRFAFYPQQNKLIKEATEITLSRKECELLAIFVANLNQVVKREELTKKVWEDNGVFVGRSLDTYISKLRKKLKGDDSIAFTNVHGVGYKLEVIP